MAPACPSPACGEREEGFAEERRPSRETRRRIEGMMDYLRFCPGLSGFGGLLAFSLSQRNLHFSRRQ